MSDLSNSPRNSLSSDDFRSSAENAESTDSTPPSPAELIQKVRRQSLLGRDGASDVACVDSAAHLAQQVAAVARMNLEFNDEDIAFDDESGRVFAVHSESVELGMPAAIIAQLTDDAVDGDTNSNTPIDVSTTSSLSVTQNHRYTNEFIFYRVVETNGQINISIEEAASSQLAEGSVCLVTVTGASTASDVLSVLVSGSEVHQSNHGEVDSISVAATWGTSSATDRVSGKSIRLLYLNLQHIYQQCNFAIAQAALALAVSLSSAVLYTSAGSIADTDIHHVSSAVSQATTYYNSSHSPRLIWLEQYTSLITNRVSDIRQVIVNDVNTPSFSRSTSPDASNLPAMDDIRNIYSYFDPSSTTIVELTSWDDTSDENSSQLLSQLAEVRYILLGQLICRVSTSTELLTLALQFAVTPRITQENEPSSSQLHGCGDTSGVRTAYRRAMSGLLREEFGGTEQQWKIDVDAAIASDGHVKCPLCRGGSEIIAAAKNVTLINELQENLHRRFDACHVKAVIDARQEISSEDDINDAVFDAEKQAVYDFYFLASLKANSAMLQVTMDSLTPVTPPSAQRRTSRNRSTSTPTPHMETPSVRLARYTDVLLLYFNRSWGLASCHVMSHFLSDMMRSEDTLWASRVEQLESRIISQEAEQRELRRRVEALTTENMQLHESLENKMDKAIDVWAAAQTKQTQMEDEAKSLDAQNKELKLQLEALARKLAAADKSGVSDSDNSTAVAKTPPPVGFAEALKFVFACAAGMEDIDARPRNGARAAVSPSSTSNGPTTE